MTTFLQDLNKFFRFTLFYWIAVFTGVFLWPREWEIVRLASIKQEEYLFGLFGFCAFCAIALSAYMDIKTYTLLPIKKIVSNGLPILVCLIFLGSTIELSRESWDYQQYEAAFRAIVAGSNPYLSNRYLYPPLFADVMVFVFRVGQQLFPLLGLDKSPWIFVFYIHQSSILFFLLLTYSLSMQFAVQIGLDDLMGMLLVSVIYLFNVPLLRTLIANQVNFYVLASILGALVALRKYPFWAGIFAALGGLIKLYPFALSAPLLGVKKWRALVGILAGSSIIILFETSFFRNITSWKQFANFYLSFPVEQESLLFRNTSPMSFFRSLLNLFDMPSWVLPIVISVVSLVVLAWYAIRFFQREKMNISGETLGMDLESFRNIGHLLDFSVLSLLIAPSAWEHHYVIVIPLAIWVFALQGKNRPWQVVIGSVLVFGLPVFRDCLITTTCACKPS